MIVVWQRGVTGCCLEALTDDVHLHVLMGGEPMGGRKGSRDWRDDLDRDSIVIGTLDMIISRCLNRGYGESRYLWPIDFGLLNSGSHFVFDEIQLMGWSSSGCIGRRGFDLAAAGPFIAAWTSKRRGQLRRAASRPDTCSISGRADPESVLVPLWYKTGRVDPQAFDRDASNVAQQYVDDSDRSHFSNCPRGAEARDMREVREHMIGDSGPIGGDLAVEAEKVIGDDPSVASAADLFTSYSGRRA